MKKGTIVTVTDWGYVYSTFRSRFEELGFKNVNVNLSPSKTERHIDDKFFIFAKSRNDSGKKIYGISDLKGNQFLMDARGIEKV